MLACSRPSTLVGHLRGGQPGGFAIILELLNPGYFHR